MERELTGIYFRVERDGRWKNLDFSDLTDDEMAKALEGRGYEWLKSLALSFGKTLRKLGEDLDIRMEA